MEINKKVDDLLHEYWGCPEIWGEKEVIQPLIILPTNTGLALSILNEHIKKSSHTLVHTDVDMDGLGTNYILRSFLCALGLRNINFCMNKDKVHGILDKHVEYANDPSHGIDLVIITDSSSNEIERIKKFNCDVIVIDHHNMGHQEFNGLCNDGVHRFAIVNNTIDNLSCEFDRTWLYSHCNNAIALTIPEFKADVDMSCGVLLYELLRVYQIAFKTPNILFENKLAQWAAITLFTDAIDLRNTRNQWYVSQLIDDPSCERVLKVILNIINPYKTRPSKTAVNYSLAPLFNKAIRANAGLEALNVLFYTPDKVEQLNVYADRQKEVVTRAIQSLETNKIGKHTNYVMFDMSALDIHKNYAGVIASRLSGDYYVNCVAYLREGDICKGSFRGREKRAKYIDEFTKLGEDVFAQGHDEAFGFKCTYSQLKDVMSRISSIETGVDTKWGISLGDMPEQNKLRYHFNSWDELRYYGGLLLIATGNSRINSGRELNFKVSADNVRFIEKYGEVFNYDVMGVNCKAFSELKGRYFNVYVEYTSEINFYIKSIGGIFK